LKLCLQCLEQLSIAVMETRMVLPMESSYSLVEVIAQAI